MHTLQILQKNTATISTDANTRSYRVNTVSARLSANIYLFKINNRNVQKRCEKCSKLIITIPERRHQRRSGIFIVNFEHISHLFLVSIFEQVDVCWKAAELIKLTLNSFIKSVFFLNLAKSGHFRLLYLKLIFHTIGQNFS